VHSNGVAHSDLGDSIELMCKAHEGQIDKSGRPYYLHPLRVAMRLAHCTAVERHTALLHGVVEDTSLTLRLHELADERFGL
jgi:(p)ppGpp synthase/HD superfamily hydrolase